MEYSQPSEIVKDLTFGSDATNKIMKILRNTPLPAEPKKEFFDL